MTETASEEQSAGQSGAAFHRVLLKLSGEALMGDREYGIDPERIEALAGEIVEVQQDGPEPGTSTAGSRHPRRGSIAPPPTTPACSRRC